MSVPEGGSPVVWKLRLAELLRSGEARKLRKQVGISQEELAQKLGASRASVIRWENGDDAPRDIRVVVEWLNLLSAIKLAVVVDPTANVRPAARLRDRQDQGRDHDQ